ncbi:DUF6150 family protein [Polaromonas aquatica]|uniref:DUF6150 family protein n=1 Tax=Polaromonas aquatica TaxID=332657 RepID=UPI003D6490DD
MPRIYESPTMGDADIRVALVSDLGQADLLVHRVSSWGLATRPWLWYMAPKQDANLYVYFCSLGMAQLTVCYVDTYGQAGWVNKQQRHPVAHLLR